MARISERVISPSAALNIGVAGSFGAVPGSIRVATAASTVAH